MRNISGDKSYWSMAKKKKKTPWSWEGEKLKIFIIHDIRTLEMKKDKSL